MHLIGSENAPPQQFMVFSIDTPTGALDSFKRHDHVQSEDERFVKALLTLTFKQFIRSSPPPEPWR